MLDQQQKSLPNRWLPVGPAVLVLMLALMAPGLLLARGLDSFVTLARDSGQWSNAAPEVREWFRSLMQPDNPTTSCCGEADAYEADLFEIDGDRYVAIITDGHGVIPNGTRIVVPNNKLKFDKGNPTGHGIIFLGLGDDDSPIVYCYVTPGGV